MVWDNAVLWQLDADGNVLAWVALPGLDGAASFDAFGINGDEHGDGFAQVVGCAYTRDGLIHPVLWEIDAEGNLSDPVDLGYLSHDHDVGDAFAINELGEVVGVWEALFASGHAFLVKPVTDDAGDPIWCPDADNDGINDVMSDLVDGEGATRSEAINDSAQVVGRTALKAFRPGAFIWQDGVMRALNDLIPSEPKWDLDSARDINEAGQIVGGGTVGGGKKSHAWLSPDAHEVIRPDMWYGFSMNEAGR